MAASPPSPLPLLPALLLLLLVRLSVTAADCGPSPAVLLAAQVTHLAQTALSGEHGHQHADNNLTAVPSSVEHPAGASAGSDQHSYLLARLQALETAVDELNETVARLGGDETPPPSRLARPGSCLQLQRANHSLPDGVYQLAGLADPVYCDFSHDGGGWTLLLTAATRRGWDRLNVRLRNAGAPSLTDDYSILRHGDALKALGTGERFAYRLEGQAETNRRQWGGIWLAPRRYTFTPETDDQRDIALVRKFNAWTYGKPSLQKTMPWINVEDYLDSIPILTTTLKASRDWWGTLVTDPATTSYNHSPWISVGAAHSGTILYWMREEELP